MNESTHHSTGMAKILAVSALFSLLLVIARIERSGTTLYISLIWNLFLAWIPYAISVLTIRRKRWFTSPLLFYPVAFVWLLFFPNAPYILTDLFHLKAKSGIPLWYDLLLIFSFAWNGMILGYLSLMTMERQVQQRLGIRIARVFVLVVIALGAYGVFLGRYLRWNSWDFFLNPFSLILEMGRMLIHPFHFPAVWGMTLLLSVMTGLMYFTLRKLARDKPE